MDEERWEPLGDGVAIAVSAVHRFGADALLLAHFAAVKPGERVCDLGTGCGILPLWLARRSRAASLVGVDIQPEAIALAQASAARCADARLRFLCADWSELAAALPAESFDRVTANPPYFPPGSGGRSVDPAVRLARHEGAHTLSEVTGAAARLLRFGGCFCLCHRPERLPDVFAALRAAGLEPKRLRLVQAAADKPPWLVLVEGKKGGRPGLRIDAPWRQDDAALLEEIYR